MNHSPHAIIALDSLQILEVIRSSQQFKSQHNTNNNLKKNCRVENTTSASPQPQEMELIALHHPWAFACGILGNIISFFVYLAPLPTFCSIYKKGSTGGFQSTPYVVALFSAMLWLYYGFLMSNGMMLITTNSIGCAIEGSYIVMYFVFAPRKAKVATATLLMSLNVGVFGLIFLLTFMLAKGSRRIEILGWICSSLSVSVFAAPLSIMGLVIRTKSVEFMPFSLSFFLVLSAVVWFCYGFLIKDMFIALPNVLGFAFGSAQMILYIIYKDAKKTVSEEKLPEEDEVARPTSAIINLEAGNQLADKQSARPIELTEIHV